MTIEDRHGKPVILNHLYIDRSDPNNAKRICKVTGLNEDLDNLFLQITYEGSHSVRSDGHRAYNLAGNLIHLSETQVNELIQDRKERLSFLESSAQSQPKCTVEKIGNVSYSVVEISEEELLGNYPAD